MADDTTEEPKGKRRKAEAETEADAPEQPMSSDHKDDSHSGTTDDQKAMDVADRARAASGRPAQHTIEDDTPAQWSYED